MANSIDKLAKELKKEILASNERKPKAYDTQAEVVRVTNGTAWVHIPGGVEETPVRMTMDAKKGDMVNIHVEKGTAWITGNGTRPPTDDSTANYATYVAEGAEKIANIASNAAIRAQESAIEANTAAEEAKADAATAKTAADGAVADAAIANTAATEAKADAATAKASADTAVQDAAAANTAATEAKADASAAKTASTEAKADAATAKTSATEAKADAQAAKTAATEAKTDAADAKTAATEAKTDAADAKSAATAANTAAQQAVEDASLAQSAASRAISDAEAANTAATEAKEDAAKANTAANSAVTGLGIVQGVVDSLSTDMDEMQTHVAMMDAVGDIPAGLHVVPTSNGYFVVLSNDGMYVYDNESTLVATFGENIKFDSVRPQKIGGDDVYIEYYDSNNDGEADSLRIVGANISSSTGIPTKVSELQNDSGYTTKTYVDNAVGDTATDLANYILSNDKAIDDLEKQIDGAIDTWYYNVDPTTSNEPAKNWTTDALKESHLRDLYFNTSNGHTWRWAKEGNTYKWIQIEDADAIKALADAAKAQTTADTKRRVFVSQPTPPYDIGDLWVQGSSGDIYKCKTAKTSAQSYAASDWDKASKYTDDSTFNTFKTTTYATDLQQTNEAISLRATKTEAQGYANTAESNAKADTTNKLKSYYTKTETDSAITQKAGEISLSVAQTEINKIEVGGRNLFKATPKAYNSAGYDAYYINLTEMPKEGETYTVQFWDVNVSHTGKTAEKLGINLYWGGGNVSLVQWQGTSYFTNGHADHLKWTFTITHAQATGTGATNQYFVVYNSVPAASGTRSLSIGKWKLEKGNKATDWSPAPEDLEAYTDTQVSAAKAEIKVTTDSISSEVSKVSSAKYVTSSGSGWTLPNIKTYAAEGHIENWNVTSTENIRVGDVVYVYGKDTTRNCYIYIKITVRSVESSTRFSGVSHGYEDILPVETIKSTINQSADSVKIQAKHVEIDGTATFNAIKAQTDAAYDAKDAASTVQTNLEASAIAQEQRIYYRSKVSGTVPKPTAWVTNTADKYNDTVSVGNSGWSTKVTPIASGKGSGVTKYLYLYTCIQRKTVSGAVSSTDVLLDDSTTVIDGGNIVTGTVTANQIGANAITSDKIAANAVTVGKINPLVYEYNNDGRGAGYAKICTISITETYRNKPIIFTIQSRNKYATSVSFMFQNSNNPSTAKVQSATYDGDIPLYYVGTSQTYDIYFQLSERYDNVRIYNLILPYSTGLEVTWAGEYYGTSLPTGAVAFAKLAGSRKSSDIDNAAKTATSYITHIDNNGIRIHPSSTENDAAVINNEGMEIYKGGVSVAKYGDTARVGQEEKSHMLISDTSIEGISENGTKFFSISSNGGEGTSENVSRIAWDLDNTATSYNLSSVLGEKWTSLANGKEFSIYVEYYETKDNHIVRRWQAPLGTSFTKGQSRDTSIGINYTAPDTVIIKQYYPTLDDGYVFSHKDVYFSVEITQSNMPLYRFGTGVAEIGGNNSFLMGTGTVASYNNQLAIGEYNMDSMYALFMVGKGESERRKNVFEVGAWNNVEDGYVRINDKKVADFVIETGEVEVKPSGQVANYGTGNWEWREWYSGKVEMWYSGSITLNQIASNAGGLYRYLRRIPLPISPLYRLTCIVNGTAGGGWLNCGGLFNNSDLHQEPYTRIEIMAYQINARPAQEQTNVNIYACGNLYE